LNVERTSALYRIQRAGLFPSIGVMGTGEVHRLPKKMSPDGNASTEELYTVNLGTLSWEIDFFGRIRSLEEAALHQYFATEQARAATQISLVAAVAGAYLARAADAEQLRLSQETLDAYSASYDMILESRDAGIASDLDLREVESQVEAARADIARYRGLVALDENALQLLVGAPITPEMLPQQVGVVTELKDVPAELPSDVLLRRPDVVAAEFQLLAANANIGAARAAFFPRITLTAGTGTMSAGLDDLFKAGSWTWSVAPELVTPIFASGSLLANLRVSKLDREIAVAQYEKAIQSAFREVSDSLALRETLMSQEEAQQALVRALDESCRLSEARYREGIDSYLGVLVTQRALYVAQRSLVSVRLARQANLVALYKALGGGA
jgi:multidrug efflux system outer membrane protein